MKKSAILQKNIDSISKYNSNLLSMLQVFDFEKESTVYEESEATHSSAGYMEINERKYLLHSKYEPIKEAKKIVEKIDYDRDSLIIVFGLGLGYHLFELKNRISKDTRVFIIEHNLDALKNALLNVDLSPIFDSPQFLLLFGNKEMIDLQVMVQVGANFYNMALNMQVISLPNYYIYKKENLYALKQINNRITNILISYGNDLEDMFVGFRNNYLNVDAAMESNSIVEINDKYKNKPAIIVASGPSLEKNMHHLKDAYGKALILTCDASLRACESLGVKPDAMASIERDKPTYDFYYKNREIDKDIVLLGPGVLWPDIYSEYKGKKIIMSKSGEGIENWWHSHFSNIEFVGQGYSCANVAFAAAVKAGCNPIILVGQDLAYTDGKNHSNITHHEEEEYENDDKEADRDEAVVYLEDYEGNLLKSHWVYKIFKEWFEYQITINPQLTVIDATEGGAYIKGSKLMSLKGAVDKYCVENLEKHLVNYLDNVKVDESFRYNKYKEIHEDLIIQIEILQNIKREAKNHFDLLRKITEKYNIEKCNEDTLVKIVKKMQGGDKIIQHILNSEDSIKTFYRQIITQTIIFVKQIGNKLNNENVKRNHNLQRNLMFIINESTDFIINEFEKAKDFFDNKINQLGEEI